MNCRSAEHLFSSYLEEELSQKERRSFESHLADCLRCTSAVEEMRATVELMSSLPAYETSPHFEDAVLDRIRSGEALRPTLIEWLAEWFTPSRLRPAFLTGAAGAAVWIAALMMQPATRPVMVAQTPNGASAPAAPASPGTSTSSTLSTPATALPAGSEVVASRSRSEEHRATSTPPPMESRTVAEAPRGSSAPDSAASAYQDEYILDQFYLNRSSEEGVHSIVPVTGRASDDVYIIF